MIRAVLDPNVLISGLISSRGAPRRLLDAWYDGAIELVVCPMLLGELLGALSRPRIARYVHGAESDRLVAAITRNALGVSDPGDIPQVCADPNDDYLFALARQAGAVLVSGDNRVLEVTDAGVRVLRVAAVLEIVQEGPQRTS